MSDEKIPHKLRIAREGSQVHLDRAQLARLAARLEARRRRGRTTWLLAGAASAAAVALLVLLVGRPRPRHDLHAGAADGSAAPVTRLPAGARGPRLVPAAVDPAEVPHLVDDANRNGSPGPLEDLAADRGRAQALWAGYQRSPDTHPAIPNVSRAGYRQGEAAAPPAGPAHVQVNVRAEPFRAAGDGVTDDTEAIRRALAAVPPEGGVVYLPNGDYLLSDVLFISSSRTVLRGQSREGTRLVFTRPLDVLMGANVRGEYSRWQWSGGLVWFASASRRPSQASGATGWNGDGWSMGPELTALALAARRGDRSIEVASGAGLRAGALVFLVADGGLSWPVEIAAVDGRRVTLRQALRHDLPSELKPRLRAGREADLIRDSGVERMTLVMRRDQQWDQLSVSEVHGWNGVYFENAVHGFARELAVIDGHQAATAASSKNVTFSDISLRSSGTPDTAGIPRGIAVRHSSHDVLIERVDVDPRYWFRLRIEGSGHAVSRVRGPLRWIGGPAVDALLTDLTVTHPDRVAAPPGTRVAAWGIHYERPDVRVTAAEPPNLYEAQQQLRRGTAPAPRR